MKIVPKRWKQSVSVKDLGSVTLGFLDVTLETTELGPVDISGIVVRLTVEGVPTLSFPRRVYSTANGERSAEIVRIADEAKFRALVAGVFAIPAVLRAVSEAERIRAEMKKSA